VGFRLQNQNRGALDLRAASSEREREARVAQACGEEFLQNALYLEERSDLKLSGWLALPSFSRAQADLQYFYVNGRAVRDKLLGYALRRAYADVLHSTRYPAYVLYLEMDPATVDVNVASGQAEVRFRDSTRVHDFLFGTVHRVIRGVQPNPSSTIGCRWPASVRFPALPNRSACCATKHAVRATAVRCRTSGSRA